MDPAVNELRAFVDSFFQDDTAIRVLEAGCGSASYLERNPSAVLVGIDISQEQLDRNKTLSEKILGDLQTYRFPPGSFDLIVCWDVLEHLPRPQLAMNNLFEAIAPDRLVVLAMPDVRSLKGQFTRWTPHWFHVWVYRKVFGIKAAGTEGRGPFKTFLRSVIAADSIRRIAAGAGLREVHFREYESQVQQDLRYRMRIRGPIWQVIKTLTRLLSLGRSAADRTDFIVVLQRNSTAPSATTR
jgi:SAM-dependent methyltransferase